jgi:hypothetical protein
VVKIRMTICQDNDTEIAELFSVPIETERAWLLKRAYDLARKEAKDMGILDE